MKDDSAQKLRILFISRAFPPVIGGIEKQNFEIHKHLRQLADVTLVANRHGKKLLPIFLPFASLYTIFRANRYDVVLLGDGVLSCVAWVMSLARSRSLVCCILHGLDITYAKPIYQRWWVEKFLPKVDLFLPVSRQTAQAATTRGLNPERCQIIPNGVNPDEFSQEFDLKELKRIVGFETEDCHIILTVGRLVKRKGIHWFVENVMPRLDENIIYIVAGDGPMRDSIKRIITDNNLGSRVILLGRVSHDDLRTLYAASDIFVQPNIRVQDDMEGFGLVLLEAGASGLPVIASRLEGLQDAVCEGETGQLVESELSEDFIEKIQELLKDKKMRLDKGQRAMSYISQHFTWKIVADRYMGTFKNHLQKNNDQR